MDGCSNRRGAIAMGGFQGLNLEGQHHTFVGLCVCVYVCECVSMYSV